MPISATTNHELLQHIVSHAEALAVKSATSPDRIKDEFNDLFKEALDRMAPQALRDKLDEFEKQRRLYPIHITEERWQAMWQICNAILHNPDFNDSALRNSYAELIDRESKSVLMGDEA